MATASSQQLNDIMRQQRADFGARLKPAQQISDQLIQRAWGSVVKEFTPVLADLRQVADEKGANARAFRAHNSAAQLGDAARIQLAAMATVIRVDAQRNTQAGIQIGRAYGVQAIDTSGVNVPIAVADQDVIDAAANYIDSVAFQAVIEQFAGFHADQAVSILTAGIAAGKNPGKIVDEITNYITNFPEADALRITRTVLIWSMRQAAHETFRANSDVLDGWVWSASLDVRCCMSCVAMNGTFHTLDEPLDDHDSGRCAPSPVTKSWSDLGFDGGSEVNGVQSGADWFDAQDEATQQDMMGKAAWAAWQDGQFDISDYPTTYDSDIYGQMRRAQSLTELIGDEQAKQYVRQGRAA